MDLNVVMQLISTLGFPIVCCAALFWKMNKDEESHQAQMLQLTEAVNNNTLALQRLADSICRDEKEDNNAD